MEIAREGIYFMYSINYSDIIKNYMSVMQYCLKFSDSFSVITNLKKPYSKKHTVCEHDDVINKWDFCLEKQIIGIKKWPGTETKDTHKVMNIYNSRKFRTNVSDVPNFFSPIEYGLPEDICFYRNGVVWFVTISHEKMAFLYSDRIEDYVAISQSGDGLGNNRTEDGTLCD